MKTLMKSLAVAATVAAASLGTTAVNAATPLTLTDDGNGGFNVDFAGNARGAFSQSYTVSLPKSGATDVGIQITNGTLTSGMFNGQALDLSANNKYLSYTFDFLAAGDYAFSFMGMGNSGGKFSGTVSLTPAAVPEPASWALMIGGVGVVGGAMRRRQRTTVSFA